MTADCVTAPELDRLLSSQLPSEESIKNHLYSPLHRLVAFCNHTQLSTLFTKHSFGPGQIIFREGEIGDAIYLISAGRAAVIKGSLDSPSVLGYRFPGDIIGEMSLFVNQPQFASVVALEALSASRVERSHFEQFLLEHPSVTMNLVTTLNARLRTADEARTESLHVENQLVQRVLELQVKNKQLRELQKVVLSTRPIPDPAIDLTQIMALTLECVEKVVSYHQGIVLLQKDTELRPVATRGLSADLESISEIAPTPPRELFDEIRQTRRPLLISGDGAYSDIQQARQLPQGGSLLGVPLISGDQVTGLLILTRTTGRPFSDHEINLVATFAEQAAGTLGSSTN